MNKSLKTIILLGIFCGSARLAQPADDSDQLEFPQLTRQPLDLAVHLGSNAVFSAQATNGAVAFQWLRNGAAMEDQTNSDLILQNVGTNDVGYYTCNITKAGGESVPTRSASLNVVVATAGGPITVYGLPVISGGSQGTCPGGYAGYVNFIKTVAQGWGWAPSTGTSTHTAADINRTDTKVQYVGKFGDSGCNQTTVTVPHPTQSPKYRFAIYFPNNVPTGSYPITLTGFDP